MNSGWFIKTPTYLLGITWSLGSVWRNGYGWGVTPKLKKHPRDGYADALERLSGLGWKNPEKNGRQVPH